MGLTRLSTTKPRANQRSRHRWLASTRSARSGLLPIAIIDWRHLLSFSSSESANMTNRTVRQGLAVDAPLRARPLCKSCALAVVRNDRDCIKHQYISPASKSNRKKNQLQVQQVNMSIRGHYNNLQTFPVSVLFIYSSLFSTTIRGKWKPNLQDKLWDGKRRTRTNQL